MRQRPWFYILILAIAPMFMQCNLADGKVVKGDGQVVTTTQDLAFFNAIELHGAFSNVRLERGTKPGITMETDDNLQDLFQVEVSGNTLKISSDRDIILQPTKMYLTITYPELNRLSIHGAGKISAFEKLTSESLSLEISGAADLSLEVEVGSLRTQVSGAGNIALEGNAENHEISLSGASNLDASRLLTESTRISLSGAGAAKVHASERLEASLSGIGRITYLGDPREKIFDKSGLGSISSAD
jgi:hypothetical protein